MKKTLYLKFILAYFIFGVFSFIMVTTFVPNMTKEHLIREKAENLYFAGEVLDVDAVTGGFNLQIAWSTGHLAGESIE